MTSNARLERIGLIGGSFDPPHVGHIALAKAAEVALGLDQLRFIPTGQSWQKAAQATPAEHRLAMLRAALPAHPNWRIDTREIERGGASYTIDTLESLRNELGPNVALVMILGSDQLHNLATWHRWRELLRHCHIAATQRERVVLHDFPPEVEALLQTHGRDALSDAPAGEIVFFRMPAVPVSATRLRAALADGEPTDGLLPPAVIDHIRRHHLYQTKD